MIVLTFETGKDQKEILDKAASYFIKNTGLKMTEQDSCCIFFGELYTNYVKVTLTQKDDKFEVTVESREQEYWAQRFADEFT